MKRILKVTSILGLATVITMFSGVIRAKFLAWQLGPTGVGIIGQAMMYSVFTIQLCSLNMGTGIIKAISRNVVQGRGDRTTIIIDNSYSFQLIASLLFIAAVLPFSMPLTKFIFSDYKYWPYFVGITVVTPLAVYLIGVAGPVFYGFKKITDFTKLTILNTLSGLCLIIALVYFYGVNGVFLQIITISVIGFLTSYYFMKRSLSVTPRLEICLFKNKTTSLASINLFRYGLISFIPASLSMLVMLYLRGLFMKRYGVEANGYYQVVYAMSAYYLPFVTNAMWGHFYPEMCALKSKADINREINQFTRFAVLAASFIAAVGIIFRKFIILILFSDKFLRSCDLLTIQVTGDIFFILFCMFSTSLMARRKFKGVIYIAALGYNAVLISLYAIFSNISSINLLSLNMAIAVSNIILVAVHIVYAGADTGFRLAGKNVSLIVKSGMLIAAVCFIPDKNILITIMKAVMIAVWLFSSVAKEEIAGFAKTIFSSLKAKFTNT